MGSLPVQPDKMDRYRRKEAEWREKWLQGMQFGKSYDLEARENAAIWAIQWGRTSYDYYLGDFWVGPFCTEFVLEALQLHGGRQILPMKIDRLEDITIGLGSGFSLQGEVCGPITAHIIGIGIDVASRTRETAQIRKEVSVATRHFCRLFKTKFGCLRCADLTKLNFLKEDGTFDREADEEFRTGDLPRVKQCEDIIRFSIYAPFPSEQE